MAAEDFGFPPGTFTQVLLFCTLLTSRVVSLLSVNSGKSLELRLPPPSLPGTLTERRGREAGKKEAEKTKGSESSRQTTQGKREESSRPVPLGVHQRNVIMH